MAVWRSTTTRSKTPSAPPRRRRGIGRKAGGRAAIGKKNWLFIGDAGAGQRSAIIYTLIESCRRRGLDPFAYLREVFTRLPTMTNWQVKDLTPEAWAKARKLPDQRAAA